MKHTQGEWKAVTDKGQHSGRFFAVNSVDENITTAIVYGKDENEQAANAKLIAAAPELLKALESAVVDLRAAYELLKIDKQDDSTKFLQSLESAIKKAAV